VVVTTPAGEGGPLEPGEYCRRIEAYLCRKNDGHLVRIVGPSFERVTGWARLGIPLKVAFQGIDRAFERYHGKDRRRRPIHIDFCEADVLESFEAWRRAVGASIAESARESGGDDRAPTRRRLSLTAHLDRVLVRLSSFLAAQASPPDLRALVERVAHEVGGLRDGARGLRGNARREVVDRLASLDRELVEGALRLAPDGLVAEARAAAREELVSLRDRMAESAYDETLRRLSAREIRARLQLPTLALD
jgi:hypothetical protein